MIKYAFLLVLATASMQLVPVAYQGRFRPLIAVQDRVALDKLGMIPGREGNWMPLEILSDHPENISAYSDRVYTAIREAYLTEDNERLAKELSEGYSQIAGKPITADLFYPTLAQLRAEYWYYCLPLTGLTMAFYFFGGCFLLYGRASGLLLIILAFIVHTVLIGLRCFILNRPPVSNMFETVVYVPWMGVLIGLIYHFISKNRRVLSASALAAVVLLALLKMTDLSSDLENVQAVLNSRYWLTVHVMMVVGSYGAFILSGVLGHFYLISRKGSAKAILATMYIGTALLIPGTILGGVWAAQSWGRFWDWDPKESWAFITACVYLIIIHAHRFGKIADFGLAVGSIVGLLAVSFTWYGVNYILGTGLHSYGWGSGGGIYYALFVAFEVLFLVSYARRNLGKAEKPFGLFLGRGTGTLTGTISDNYKL